MIPAPMGPYSRVKDMFDSLSKYTDERAHSIGHYGQFGSLWPHPQGNRVAPDHWFDGEFPLPDDFASEKWMEHDRKIAEDIERFLAEMQPKGGELVILNEEVWSTRWVEGSNWWGTGRSSESHKSGVSTLYGHQIHEIRKAFPAPTPIGASGLIRRRQTKSNMDFGRAVVEANTAGMMPYLDFMSPQLYWKEGERAVVYVERSTIDICANSGFRIIPFLSPFYERTFSAVDPGQIGTMEYVLKRWECPSALVFLNCAVSDNDQWKVIKQWNIDGFRRMLEVMG